MNSRLRVVVLLLLFFIAPAQAQDQPPVNEPTAGPAAEQDTASLINVSLSTMVTFALDKNPDILMAEERENQIDFFIKEARSGYYPRVEVNLEGGRGYIEPAAGQIQNNTGKASLIISQNVFDGFKTRDEVDRRQDLRNAAAFDTRARREQIVAETVQYYLSALHYQQTTRDAEAFNVRLNEIVTTIRELYEGGVANKATYDYAMSRQAAALNSLSEARSSYNDAVSNLEFLTGPLPPFQAVLPDIFRPEYYDLGFYLEQVQAQNSLILKNKAEGQAMEHQIDVEKADYFPKVSFEVEAKHSHNDGGDVGRGRELTGVFRANYKIFDGFLRESTIKRIQSQAAEIDYRTDRIFRDLSREIKLSYNQISALQNAIDATRAEIEAGKNLIALNQENFELGTINVIELIEGEERLFDAKVRLHQQYNDLFLQMYSLLITTGILRQTFFCASCEKIEPVY